MESIKRNAVSHSKKHQCKAEKLSAKRLRMAEYDGRSQCRDASCRRYGIRENLASHRLHSVLARAKSEPKSPRCLSGFAYLQLEKRIGKVCSFAHFIHLSRNGSGFFRIFTKWK